MEDMIYLDNSATTFPKPPEVYDFMDSFYRKFGVNPGRSGYDMCMATEEIIHGTRKKLTALFNGNNPHCLTFSYNASDSLNMLIQGLAEKGDHVVTTCLEHNSVLRPLYHLEQQGLIEVSYVPFDNFGYVNPEDIDAAIKPNTKMVIVNHGSNVIGTVQPAAEIGAVCKKRDVLFIMDVSQTAGAVPVDVQAMHADAVVFTGHKCLMGPTGIGGAYCREDLPVRSTRYGGTGVRSAQRTHLSEWPYRLECGTLNSVGVAGLHAGQLWLEKEGLKNIHAREMALWVKLRDGLEKIEGVTTFCAQHPDNHIAVLSFVMEGMEPADVGTMLDVDYNIACRTGLQCAPLVHETLGTADKHGTVRFSIGPFNTEAHIDTAIEAIEDIASIPR